MYALGRQPSHCRAVARHKKVAFKAEEPPLLRSVCGGTVQSEPFTHLLGEQVALSNNCKMSGTGKPALSGAKYL